MERPWVSGSASPKDALLTEPEASVRRTSVSVMLSFAWGAGAFSSADARLATGLSRSTVLAAIEDLIDRGLLNELPDARSVGEYRRGRPARRFELRAEGGAVVGIDVGDREVSSLLTDLRGSPLAQAARPMGGSSPVSLTQTVANVVEDVLRDARIGRSSLLTICVGLPTSPTSLFRGVIGGMAPMVRFDNDAGLAAAAEGAVGAAIGCENYVVLLMGKRLSTGIVIGGQVLRGAPQRAAASDLGAIIGTVTTLTSLLGIEQVIVSAADPSTRVHVATSMQSGADIPSAVQVKVSRLGREAVVLGAVAAALEATRDGVLALRRVRSLR